MYDYLDSDGVQAVLEAIKNKSDAAIAETQDLANSMLKDVVNVIVNPTTSTGTSVNETKFENTTGIAFSRGNGEYVSGRNFTDTYYKYGNANASKDGLLSAEDFSFIDKYKKIRNSSASYTFETTQDFVTLGFCSGTCRNGIVVLSGIFISTGNGGNITFAKGAFPCNNSTFLCGVVYNTTTDYGNSRLLVGNSPNDGEAYLVHGGAMIPGQYFFMGVYTTEICSKNLPYTL